MTMIDNNAEAEHRASEHYDDHMAAPPSMPKRQVTMATSLGSVTRDKGHIIKKDFAKQTSLLNRQLDPSSSGETACCSMAMIDNNAEAEHRASEHYDDHIAVPPSMPKRQVTMATSLGSVTSATPAVPPEVRRLATSTPSNEMGKRMKEFKKCTKSLEDDSDSDMDSDESLEISMVVKEDSAEDVNRTTGSQQHCDYQMASPPSMPKRQITIATSFGSAMPNALPLVCDLAINDATAAENNGGKLQINGCKQSIKPLDYDSDSDDEESCFTENDAFSYNGGGGYQIKTAGQIRMKRNTTREMKAQDWISKQFAGMSMISANLNDDCDDFSLIPPDLPCRQKTCLLDEEAAADEHHSSLNMSSGTLNTEMGSMSGSFTLPPAKPSRQVSTDWGQTRLCNTTTDDDIRMAMPPFRPQRKVSTFPDL